MKKILLMLLCCIMCGMLVACGCARRENEKADSKIEDEETQEIIDQWNDVVVDDEDASDNTDADSTSSNDKTNKAGKTDKTDKNETTVDGSTSDIGGTEDSGNNDNSDNAGSDENSGNDDPTEDTGISDGWTKDY